MAMASVRMIVAALALPLVVACGGSNGTPPGSTPDPSENLQPLVKAEGWRDGLVESFEGEHPYALLELAFDEETAQRAWEENVPGDLEQRSGPPAEPGRYGDLSEVDFDTQAVVVWSSGQSGSCPAWLAGIATEGDGAVKATTEQQGSTCTDDYNAYRMVLVAHRDLLPEPTWLPMDEVVVDSLELAWDSLVREYPSQ